MHATFSPAACLSTSLLAPLPAPMSAASALERMGTLRYSNPYGGLSLGSWLLSRTCSSFGLDEGMATSATPLGICTDASSSGKRERPTAWSKVRMSSACATKASSLIPSQN